MFFKRVFATLCLLILITLADSLNNKRFPANFMIGASTASYQIEGAWNEHGKGENIWDRFSHTTHNAIKGNHTGDIACDSYHKYKEDVAMSKFLGLTHYRFSISWSRILPTGFNNYINDDGLTYYKNLIKELRDNGIQPMVTIFHWDTPQPLQNIGGWTNELIVDKYVDYARILFENFGNDVKYWTTFNEPKQSCHYGYGLGVIAPGIQSPGIGEYLCAHNIIKSHAKVWHMYNKEFKNKQQGVVGFAVDSFWMEPETDTEEDKLAAERKLHFAFGWFINPLTKGDYPIQMKQLIKERSAMQGFSSSRLPEFTEQEIELTKGTLDYLGVNFYTSQMIRHVTDINKTEVSWDADQEAFDYQPKHWESSASYWLKITPWGLKKLLNWIKATYGNVPQFITENGYSDNGTTLEDDERIHYYQQHLSSIRDAMDDGANVIGYITWSLMDNFEWTSGYTQKFGLYHVDFNHPNRTRTPKKSVTYFKYVATTKCIMEESKCTKEVPKFTKYDKIRVA